MLVVKVELWPMGDEKARREIARGYIANDGTGTERTGHYSVTFCKEDVQAAWRAGRVEMFPRKRLSAWSLIYRALGDALRDLER